MKLLALIVCTAFFAAVHGKRFEYKCIRLDVNGTVTVTAKNTKTNTTSSQTINLSTVTGTKTTGNCSKAQTAVMMNVAFSNTTSWKLAFTNASGQVKLDQSVTFDPATMFKSCSANGSLTLSPAKSLPLSSSNASYLCESEETINFSPKTEGDCSFSITQNITNIQVQAFGLPNGTYSPAEHCTGDQTTMAPTTEATTVPTPTEPVPVKKESFVVQDTKGNVCFRLEAGLQLVVEYETTDKAMVYSKVIPIHKGKVNGTCAGSGNTATMVIGEEDFKLNITETRSKDAAASDIKLDITLNATNFPKALHANKTVSFELNQAFEQSRADTFYVCDSEQTLKLKSENTTAMLYTNDVQMQAFNLKNGSFSGNGARCGLDPTPSPMPPASKPGDNQYVVRENASVVCLVLKGEISFSNVTYMKKSGMAQANPINIPAINETSGNVMYNGSCNLENGSAQRLVITFNRNWTLTLIFARGTSKDSSMLTATSNEFTLRDIEFVYYMVPEFFPNATTPYLMVVANQTNITSDFMKGAVGGSYKCDAKQTEQLNNGIEVQTAKFQFKAFNSDNSTTFNNNVSECSADDESNSIVPIAVGAALAGLVAIVLIAYLIGRRRSRRQGYESV